MSLLLAVATALLAFTGALLGQLLTRRATRELEVRSRREETMRNLRWAAELAVDADQRRAQLGLSQLEVLADSDLLDPEQRGFVEAGLTTAAAEQ